MADINTVIADIETAQNDAYAVAGTPSLRAQLTAAQAEIATLQGELTTANATVATLQGKVAAAQADAAKVTTDLQ